MASYIRIVICVLTATSLEALKLPKYFHKCRANDTNLGQCISDSANIVIAKLVKGNKYFDLPPLSNFKVGNVISPIDAPFKFKLKHGIAGKLEDVRYIFSKFDYLTKAARATAFFSELQLRGIYELSGEVHNKQMQGSGFAIMTFSDVYCKLFWNMDVDISRGVSYVNVTSLFVEYEIKSGVYRFSKLSENDMALGNEAILHLNRHWEILARIIAPVLMQNFSNVALKIGRAVTPKIPLMDILIF